MTLSHVPVMLPEVLQALAPQDGATYLDATFGGGGYAGAILAAADCTLWAIDRDPDAIARGAELAGRYPGRLHLLHGSFAAMLSLLAARGVDRLDGVVMDLGLSLLPDRRPGARLLVPRRRPARHAHGPWTARPRPSWSPPWAKPSWPTRSTNWARSGCPAASPRAIVQARGEGAHHHHGAARRHHPPRRAEGCLRYRPGRPARSRRCVSG